MTETTPPSGLDAPLIRATDVVKHFPVPSRRWGERAVVHAVDGVSLEVRVGETLGLVGESGCGKSTLGRCLVRLTELTSGTVEVAGTDISTLSANRLRPHRSTMQMVFQDPFSSLNPRKRVGASIGGTMAGRRGGGQRERVRELLALVGLRPEHADRFPHEFSGGQRQRIGIARALAAEPRVIVADEPVSALDVSIQAQVVNLLADLQESLGLTYVFIAHDLAVVRQISDRIAVMYLGRLAEVGPADEIVGAPLHPYTQALLASVPSSRRGLPREQVVVRGDVPSPIDPPSGCRFHPRCPRATEVCRVEQPPLVVLTLSGHGVACHHPLTEG